MVEDFFLACFWLDEGLFFDLTEAERFCLIEVDLEKGKNKKIKKKNEWIQDLQPRNNKDET